MICLTRCFSQLRGHRVVSQTRVRSALDLQATLRQVEKFAEESTPRLFKGDKLSESERKRVVEKLAAFTACRPIHQRRTCAESCSSPRSCCEAIAHGRPLR